MVSGDRRWMMIGVLVDDAVVSVFSGSNRQSRAGQGRAGKARIVGWSAPTTPAVRRTLCCAVRVRYVQVQCSAALQHPGRGHLPFTVTVTVRRLCTRGKHPGKAGRARTRTVWEHFQYRCRCTYCCIF